MYWIESFQWIHPVATLNLEFKAIEWMHFQEVKGGIDLQKD